jgi:hypothetical protein
VWTAPITIFLLGFSPSLVAQEAAPPRLTELCEQFTGFDQNGDGQVEITRLQVRAEISQMQDRAEPQAEAPRVLILCEARLLAPDSRVEAAPSLAPELKRMVADLGEEGWAAALIEVELPASQAHRDGRVLLGLREFLRAVAKAGPLDGVILVGRFPDAFLVRTVNWRKNEALTLHKGKPEQRSWATTRFVRRVPEPVADRCDIVLADLDGNWEELYIGPRVKLPATYAVFEGAIPANGGLAVDVQSSGVAFEDCFHLPDGRLEISETSVDGETRYWVSLHDRDADLECAPSDSAFINRISQPDIFVSRIDAHGIALSPNAEIQDMHGKRLLDENGKPQSLEFADANSLPSWSGAIWSFDPQLERALLRDYFDRNHAYRSGAAELAFRPASIACELGSGYSVMKAAAPEWKGLSEEAADLRGKPTLVDFVAWLQLPAVLRTVRAHSDSWGSVFGKAPAAELDAVFASTERGAPLSWTPRGTQLIPSLRQAAGGGKLDFFLLRSLWQTELVSAQSALYLHTGCQGISPPGASTLAFDHPNYGRRGGGESLLFYGRGLAMLGRAKVFYDEPRGFAQELAAGRTIGHAWARYFDAEARVSWANAGGDIGRKRAYFWSVLGDWTLRLQRPAT